MKFRFLLWAMGLLMARASRNNPAFQQQLKDKDLVFQMQTLDGKVARHFIVSGERISSKGGSHPQPAFAIAFKDAAYGFATMQAATSSWHSCRAFRTRTSRSRAIRHW